VLDTSILNKIVAVRRRRVEQVKAARPLQAVQKAAEARRDYRDFARALARGELSVIAELKRASPSKGLLRAVYRRREIAESYERAGASAISVLTEEEFFLGALDDLTAVRDAVDLPILRKDFILDEYQVYESAAAGADALLLIVAVLEDQNLKGLIELSGKWRMASLVEVHTEEELRRALDAGAEIIGVNNRDLNSLEVDLETSLRLRQQIPSSCIAVSESGIKTADDLRTLSRAGFDAALIGEHLMLADDPGEELARLFTGVPLLKAVRT
jgi:indole-3-glycerol phosphate synthase